MDGVINYSIIYNNCVSLPARSNLIICPFLTRNGLTILIWRHFLFFLFVYWGVESRSTWHCGHQWPIVLALGDYDGEIGGMTGRGNRSTRRKPAPVPLCLPQTPHAARTWTRATAVGSKHLTAWAMALPIWRHGKRENENLKCNK
jgi:hypothetical protein